MRVMDRTMVVVLDPDESKVGSAIGPCGQLSINLILLLSGLPGSSGREDQGEAIHLRHSL
jgi:hypothetical protein